MKRLFAKLLGINLDLYKEYPNLWEANQSMMKEIEGLAAENKRLKELLEDNPVIRLMKTYRMQGNSISPREVLNPESRRAYCARIAGLHRELKELIKHKMNVAIEEDARSLFDPSRFQNAESQRAFLAGNLNFGDILETEVQEIFNEHLGNVEDAKTGIPGVEQNLIPKITEDSTEMSPEQGDGLQMDIFGMVNNIKEE